MKKLQDIFSPFLSLLFGASVAILVDDLFLAVLIMIISYLVFFLFKRVYLKNKYED